MPDEVRRGAPCGRSDVGGRLLVPGTTHRRSALVAETSSAALPCRSADGEAAADVPSSSERGAADGCSMVLAALSLLLQSATDQPHTSDCFTPAPYLLCSQTLMVTITTAVSCTSVYHITCVSRLPAPLPRCADAWGTSAPLRPTAVSRLRRSPTSGK